MSEMVERVAKALYRDYCQETFGGANPGTYREWKWKWEQSARAAIEAMRTEPTKAMYDAARYDWMHNHGPESRVLHGENIKGIFNAMIDAALKEGNGDG